MAHVPAPDVIIKVCTWNGLEESTSYFYLHKYTFYRAAWNADEI